MADPISLAAMGAVGGALLKPKNPLQGALLGATAGFTGGSALGIGAAGGAAAGTAGAAGAAGTAANTALAGQVAAQPALSYAGGNIANAAASTLPATSNAAGLSFAGMSPGAANVANTAPSFMDKIGMAGKSAYENPMMTAQALNATQGLLSPGEQPPSAPAVPVQARNKLGAYDPMAAMDPYKQSVLGGQPISLI
jgi:hypothetical protein